MLDGPYRIQTAPGGIRPSLRTRSVTESEREPLRKISGLSAPTFSGGAVVSAEDILGVSRKSSMSMGKRSFGGVDEPEEDDSERERNEIYTQIGQTNFFTYSLSALNLVPKNRPGFPELKLNFSDIMSELFSVHLPVWGCVASFYVVLLELFGVHFGGFLKS
ncbi:hypothetical protein OESDEN_03857 [Oesophagostomum dentatum]|uniref:Uncharacterized protein n=1 Tax=Oesophagostomum dentatum TaxID=61180 RepID=A0A0B1TJD6_OESDE|nr:hypothetical protein OESDEN_03857 [Oesophagostomum dentatum]